ALIIIGGAMVVAVGGLLLTHRVMRMRRFLAENEVAGFLYAVIGVVYGVLLAFVVFAVWEQFNAADQAVTAEAADLVAVFRDTQTFPAPLRGNAQAWLRAYAHQVTTEWATHGELLPHRTPDPLNPVWAIYRRILPTTAMGVAQQMNANNHLYELERQRHLRHLSGEATLPPGFWPILLLGGFLTIGFSYFLKVEDLRVQSVMTAVMACLIASILFLIFALNEPYTGQVHVSRQPFSHALQQFHALNLGGP
ncbi:MAG: DUF4239 domain-containing protein, partial [Chloroflexota bacterium]|nr:DUF4239 domain-containing protein [Chloroflexota bacterium]